MRVSAPSTADDCIAGLFRPGLLESSPEAANLYSALLAAEETSILLAFQGTAQPGCCRSFSRPRTDSPMPRSTPQGQIKRPGPCVPCWSNTDCFPYGTTIWPGSRDGLLPPQRRSPTPSSAARPSGFARWRHLRELRRRENPISTSLAVSRRRDVRMIIDLLGWARQQGRTLADLSQTDIDRFRAAGPGGRHR